MPDFLRPLTDPSSIFMLAGVLFYWWKGDRVDALWLSSFWFFMVVLSVVQGYRGQRAVKSLMDFLHPWVRVCTQGPGEAWLETWQRSEEVAAGSLVRLDEGERVPLDVRIEDARSLRVDESARTGETVAVERFAGDELKAGSLLLRGSARARVLRRWSESEWQGLRLVVESSRRPPAHLTERIGFWTRRATVFAVVLGALLAWKGGSVLLGISVALAFLPNELPAILALFTSIAALKMARERVLVRDLSSVEELGRLTLLALDKTGTLTTHQMQWVVSQPFGAIPLRELHEALWFSGAFDPGRDPIDLSIYKAISKTIPGVPHLREYPMERERRVVAHAFGLPQAPHYFAKGAPEDLARWCWKQEALPLLAEASRLASGGLRVLAVARGDRMRDGRRGLVEDPGSVDWRLVGWVAFEDPLRPEAREFVSKLQGMGIALRLVTGDHPETARAVAASLGFGDRDTALWRITPLEKKNWVERWISEGHRVGMTGDGVNDAPALRSSHVGIAMARKGTDVAREAASVLLLDDDLFDLGRAMEWARGLSHQLRLVVGFLLAGHIPLVVFTLLPFVDAAPEQWWLGPVQIAFLHLAIEPVAALAFPLSPRPDPAPPGMSWKHAVAWGLAVSVLELGAFAALASIVRRYPEWGPLGGTQILAILLSGTILLLFVFAPSAIGMGRRLAWIVATIHLIWFGIAARLERDWSWGSGMFVPAATVIGFSVRLLRSRWQNRAKSDRDRKPRKPDASRGGNLRAA